jgi:cell division septation protein DedD
MDGENVKARDRVELTLDGRQIASIVVGALVLLGVVFVLGLNVGRQLAVKQLEASRGDALAALDQPPPAPAVASDSLTYHDRLTKERSPQAEPPVPAQVPAPPAQPAAEPEPKAMAKVEAKVDPKAEPKAVARADSKPEPRHDKAEPTAKGSYVVQVAATPSRSEADKLAGKLKEYSPRVEETEIPGKGRIYRVRVGAFPSKPEAERFLKAFNGKTGSKGLVVASR